MTRIQDYYVDATQSAADEVFRYAKGVPAEKLDWKPLDGGRSVLDICRELAMTPTWAYDIIQGAEANFDEESMAAMRAEQAKWTTVEHCRTQCNERLGKLAELFRSIADDRLKTARWLPYNGGRDHTVLEMMDYPRWNFNYHVGQIAYIQTLYGDKEMY